MARRKVGNTLFTYVQKIQRIQLFVLILSKPTGNHNLHFGTVLLGIYFMAFTNTPAFWCNFMFRAIQMESFCTPSLQTAFFLFYVTTFFPKPRE